jgi:hypothetical protein
MLATVPLTSATSFSHLIGVRITPHHPIIAFRSPTCNRQRDAIPLPVHACRGQAQARWVRRTNVHEQEADEVAVAL